MTVEISPLPEELLARPQWVCWCYETTKQGKLTKVPYNARTGQKASTTNPATWSTYEQAFDARSQDHYDGVGFVFNNDYTGIDLDHCIDEETGKPNAWAQSIIDHINSYTELSPSGTGVHIIARGTIPSGVKRPGIEMYSCGRFFTMTGDRLEGYPK
jgi:putative DNA primase/helicase